MIRGAASPRPQKAPITIDDRLPLCTGEEHESGRDVCANGWAFCRDGTPISSSANNYFLSAAGAPN